MLDSVIINIISPEYGGAMFLRNVSIYLQVHITVLKANTDTLTTVTTSISESFTECNQAVLSQQVPHFQQ